MQSLLLDRTQYLLKTRPRPLTYRIISKETGLSYNWIVNVAKNDDNDYSVKRVEILYDYLRTYQGQPGISALIGE